MSSLVISLFLTAIFQAVMGCTPLVGQNIHNLIFIYYARTCIVFTTLVRWIKKTSIRKAKTNKAPTTQQGITACKQSNAPFSDGLQPKKALKIHLKNRKK